VGGRKTHTTDLKEQTLQVLELGGSEGQEPSGGIGGGTGCCLVGLKGIGSDQHESGALIHDSEMDGGVERLKHTSVDNSSGGRQDSGAAGAVRDGLVDAPEFFRGRRGGDRATGHTFRDGKIQEEESTDTYVISPLNLELSTSPNKDEFPSSPKTL